MNVNKKNAVLVSDEEKLKLRQGQTHTQRFDLLMKLIRINRMLKSAKIVR